MPPKRRAVAARSVTITDLAREAGVSKSTVSLVLQDSPLIRAETAGRVREAAQKLSYVYNRRAAELRRRSSNIIGIVVNDLTNPFFAELLVGMERRLVEAGYICLMAHTDERVDVQEKVLASMREHHAAGIILCPVFDTPAAVQETVQAWGIPLLVVVRPLSNGHYDFAGADNEIGTRLATEHLIAQGHERIAFLGRAGAGLVYERRLAGYRQAMRKHKLAVDPQWIIDIPPTRAGGRAGMRQILALRNAPHAAVCYNDVVAFGVLSELGEHGMRAGSDFAVIGFDGVAAAEHSNPPLTTMDVQPADLGAAAADVLLRRMRQPESAALRHLAVPRLVVRQSSVRKKGNAQTQTKQWGQTAMPETVDEYISAFSPEVQAVLRRIRDVVRSAAPDAEEVISYKMPAFKLNGVLVYFAAFKNHIGFYPPIRGDSRLEKAVSPYAGEKGNLRFPLDQPIPYALIERITKLRVKQDLAKAKAQRKKKA